jgi:hypothetical protein
MTAGSLLQYALTDPQVMWQSLSLYESNFTMFSSLLARKGLTASMLYGDMSGKSGFRTVGNRILEHSIRPPRMFKSKVISHTGGSTPGLNGAMFNIVTDSDKYFPNNVLQVGDSRFLLFVQNRTNTAHNTWTYQVSLKYNKPGSYVTPALLTAGNEIGLSHTNYPEISSDSYESTSGHEWHRNYMTIQRLKYTMSGSARATKIAIRHNGVTTWETQANLEMMQEWYRINERMYLWGVANNDGNGNCYLKDLDGKDIMAGDGLFAQGDAGLKFGYNRLTERVLNQILANMHMMANNDGMTEIAVLCGAEFHWEFNSLMKDVFAASPEVFHVTNADGQRGVATHFQYYQPLSNLRMYVIEHPSFSSPYEPTNYVNGRNMRSRRAVFVNLGNTVGGDPNVQLVALGNGTENRSMIMRGIPGMSGPGLGSATSGDNRIQLTASAVDAYQVHAISETALVLRNPMGVGELYPLRTS